MIRPAITLLLGFSFLCSLCGWPSKPAFAGPPVQEAVADDEKEPIRERTIYVPYQRLRALFEKEGRGVFVPYEEFRQLWDAARRNDGTAPPPQQTQRSLITAVDSIATVEAEVVSVKSTVQIELLDAGWHEIPLRLMGAALRSATIEGRPARVFQREDGVQCLLIKNADDAPIGMELVLEYSQVYQKQPGTNSVVFHPPISPIHRWEIDVDQQDAKIEINPKVALRNLGAIETPEAPQENPEAATEMTAAEEGMTRVEAYIGGADLVGFSWTAKSEGAAGLTALITAQARQEVTIDEGVVRTRTTIDYDISRADVDHLILEVPADHDIVNVFDPNVQRWEKVAADGLQRVDVQLFQPVRGPQSIVIELEKFTGGREMMVAMVQADIAAPTVRAVSAGIGENVVAVGRQQGVVVMKLAPTLRGDVFERSGLVQIDAAQLPAQLQQQAWDFAYRYATVPYSLAIRVEKLLPEISAIEHVNVSVAPDQVSFHTTSFLNIEKAGVFQLEFEVPRDFNITDVISVPEANYGEASIESYEVKEGADAAAPQKLIIQLARQSIGMVAIQIKGERKVEDANLTTPTGTSSLIPAPFARVAPTFVKTIVGRIDLVASESLRLNPNSTRGTRPAADQFPIGISRPAPERQRLVASLSYNRDGVELSYDVTRRKPHIQAEQALTINVDSGVVKYKSQWKFEVLYSGVRSLRLDLPESIAADANVTDSSVVDKVMDPQPADVAAGYVAWEFTADDEIQGSAYVNLEWEQTVGELPIGEAVSLSVPVIKAFGVDIQLGQIAVQKGESIEVVPSESLVGVQPIDPRQDLKPEIQAENVARAFEYHGDWQLTLEATRYELEEIKRTSVERGLVRMILTRSDQVAVQAIFRLRSARQRIAVRLPGVDPNATADSLDARPLTINQRSVGLERDAELFYIPYTGHSADEATVVELRYTIPRTSLLQIPEFPEDPAIQVVDLSVYMPDEWIILGQSRNWSRPQESWPGDYYASNDNEFLLAIRQGLSIGDDLGNDFPLDGVRYRFTSLKPEAGEAGGLKLRTASRRVFDISVAVVVALIGLFFAFQSLPIRVIAAAMLLVLALGTTMVEPWLATALLRWPLLGTLGVVVSAWTLHGVVWTAMKSAQAMSAIASTRKAAAVDTSAAATSSDAAPSSTTTTSVPAAPVESTPSSTDGVTFTESKQADDDGSNSETGKEG